MGVFKVTIGVMGSSKSSRAIADVKNLRFEGHRVLVFKPKQDDRDGDTISSRLISESIKADKLIYPGEGINKRDIIEGNFDCIVVDESHMLSIENIEDLYEISAVSDTDVHLYGLAMSWKGKPFMTTAIALAYADEIERIVTKDKRKNLLTHHIKKINNMPCDITQEGGEIETGDLGKGKYSTVSKQTFYNLYGMLGQLDKKEENDHDEYIDEEVGLEESENTCSVKDSLARKAYPMVGQNIYLNKRKVRELRAQGLSVVNLYNKFQINKIVDEHFITTLSHNGAYIPLTIDDFTIVIGPQRFRPFICDEQHDSEGRYR